MTERIAAPHGATIRTGEFTASLQWRAGAAREANARYQDAQKYVDSEVLRLSTPYMPFRAGILVKSGILGTVIGSGTVQWVAPYARYQYYGKVMIGKAPKQVTDKDLTYQGAPKRGAFWFERMKVDHKDQIINGAKKRAGGGA